jgi:hypothetical protein
MNGLENKFLPGETRMRKTSRSKPKTVYLLFTILMFQGISGVAGGLMLIYDPTGNILNLPLGWLAGSPFADFLIPGLILFLVLGCLPLLVSFGLWFNFEKSRLFSVLTGLALIIWIGVETLVVGYQPDPPLQAVYGLIGITILYLALTPGVKSYSRDEINNRNPE